MYSELLIVFWLFIEEVIDINASFCVAANLIAIQCYIVFDCLYVASHGQSAGRLIAEVAGGTAAAAAITAMSNRRMAVGGPALPSESNTDGSSGRGAEARSGGSVTALTLLSRKKLLHKVI